MKRYTNDVIDHDRIGGPLIPQSNPLRMQMLTTKEPKLPTIRLFTSRSQNELGLTFQNQRNFIEKETNVKPTTAQLPTYIQSENKIQYQI